MTTTTTFPEIGEIFQHGQHQVQVYAIDKGTLMIGIEYLNGIRSAITFDSYREASNHATEATEATEATR
jgi:hypothetical protein